MLANKKASYPIRWSSCFSTRPPITATRSTSSTWIKTNWQMLIPITKDECFYNFKCLRPMSGLLPFNSVLSNISYVGAGFNAPSSPSCLAHASLLSPSCLSLITCLSLLTHLTGLSQASSSSSVSRWETWREGKSSKGFPPPLPNLGEQKIGN